jgi:glycosyltransferase involved in cell wall biosynthesis
MLLGPGNTMHDVESIAYAAAVAPTARRLRDRFAFDLIHAHFTYPDGVVACRLGRAHGVPVVISEHAPWLPWMQHRPIVRRQAIWAARSCASHVPVSNYVRRTIAAVSGEDCSGDPLGVPVDGRIFRSPELRTRLRQLLFVGATRHTKGVDVLLDAMARLGPRYGEIRLAMVGDAFYTAYARCEAQLMAYARRLGIEHRIDRYGGRSRREVAALMAQSAVLVVPSRAESFGAVLIEALACGTPVVATRSGGPEEIVTPGLGEIVEPEDPAGLATALMSVLDHPERYDPLRLRREALARFGFAAITDAWSARYAAAVADRTPTNAAPLRMSVRHAT